MNTKQKWFFAGIILMLTTMTLAVEPLLELPGGQQLRSQILSRYSPKMVRTWKPLWAISSQLQQSVIRWEDPTFFHHAGLSYGTILQALSENLRKLRYARGGSTITQQVAKNFFLTGEKTLRRKYQDAVLARRIEKVLSKEEILEVYLNSAEWGDNIHGAEAAARFYFGVSADQLYWSESALLAAILPNPHLFNPCVAREEALRRRNVLLDRLREDGRINEPDYRAAVATSVECLHHAQSR
jgi:membrane peptidoglycan carboxypeptidase